MIDEGLTERIIGCAFRVYNMLGAGFLESVYEKALQIELESSGLQVEAQKAIEVHYRGICVGSFYADLVVEGKVILELKALDVLIKAHEVQLVNYLKATGIDVGLLIKFGSKGFQVKRKHRKSTHPGNPIILSSM